MSIQINSINNLFYNIDSNQFRVFNHSHWGEGGSISNGSVDQFIGRPVDQ